MSLNASLSPKAKMSFVEVMESTAIASVASKLVADTELEEPVTVRSPVVVMSEDPASMSAVTRDWWTVT